MDMKKIGVLNCSHIYNFGSVLQSYAMEKIIANISGYETKSIRYNQKKGGLLHQTTGHSP